MMRSHRVPNSIAWMKYPSYIAIFWKAPIERARVKDARPYEVKLGNELSQRLREKTRRFILRRTKESVNSQA